MSCGPLSFISRYGSQFLRELRIVVERVVLGVFLHEEIERVDHRHLGDQVDLDRKLARLLQEHQPRQVVAEGVLLPVDEVLAPA